MVDAGFRAVLLDIEGTTTPVAFVTGVLFRFARERMEGFLREHGEEADVGAAVEALRREHALEPAGELPPAWGEPAAVEAAAAYACWLIDRDRKSTPLKALQGRIWEAGYRDGSLRAPVYDDVPPALARWTQSGREVSIFSSGSVLAQELLFRHSTAGDLTRFLGAYFDTSTGAKRETGSYARIAQARGNPAGEFLFLSDVPAELDAARAAGMRSALCVRPGAPEPGVCAHPVIRSFDELP
jgi:enolase-phosphatase E1